MTREELAAIKAEWERVTAADPTTASEFWPTMQAVPALLAEVERLRALVWEAYEEGAERLGGMNVEGAWKHSDARKAEGD